MAKRNSMRDGPLAQLFKATEASQSAEKDAEEGYKDMVTGLDRKPYANPAGVTNVIRLMKRSNPKVENVKPEALIDDRILKKIDQSGFIDEVMAKYGVK